MTIEKGLRPIESLRHQFVIRMAMNNGRSKADTVNTITAKGKQFYVYLRAAFKHLDVTSEGGLSVSDLQRSAKIFCLPCAGRLDGI